MFLRYKSHFPFSCISEFMYTYTLILAKVSIFPVKVLQYISSLESINVFLGHYVIA